MHRRIVIAVALLSAVPPIAPSQEHGEDAVKWQYTAAAVPSAGERLYELRFTGRIDEGYIVYGPDFNADIGPRPMRIKVESPDTTAQGDFAPTGTRRKKDLVFKSEYTYFAGTAQLAQRILVQPGATRVSGTLRGQTCREADGTCALFSHRFEIELR